MKEIKTDVVTLKQAIEMMKSVITPSQAVAVLNALQQKINFNYLTIK